MGKYRICDGCAKADEPVACDLWKANYENNSIALGLEIEFKQDYHLDVELSIEIKECKGFV